MRQILALHLKLQKINTISYVLLAGTRTSCPCLCVCACVCVRVRVRVLSITVY
jgi:hypothetical protein